MVHVSQRLFSLEVFTIPNRKTLFLQAFSISQIATAYCDEGQNYKNLVGYVKGLSESNDDQLIIVNATFCTYRCAVHDEGCLWLRLSQEAGLM